MKPSEPSQGPSPSQVLADSLDLQKIDIFADAATVTLNRLAMATVRRRFDAGQQIIGHNSDTREVMLLLSGEVKATVFSVDGREVAFRRIHAGEVFGDYSALDQKPRSADVVAVTDVVVGMVSPPEFMRLVTADPAVAKAQMRELVGMIRYLSQRVYELTALRAGERLASHLLRLAEPVDDNQAVIDATPTHTELAALIGSQRHVITTEFTRLERMGLIEREGKTTRLLDLGTLATMAEHS